MRKIINHLRNRSEEDRRHILHILTFGCGILLIIVWIYSLGKTISSPEAKAKMKEDIKPFVLLKDSLVKGTGN